jgi:hypothetical protein
MTQRYWGSTTGSRKFDYDELLEHSFNRQHDYRPTFVKFGDVENKRTYGIELEFEVDEYQKLAEVSRDLLVALNKDNRHFYVKYDGSLNHGIEFVSMPMTLDYITNTFNPKTMSDLMNSLKLSATKTCGYHIHIGGLGQDVAPYPLIERVVDNMYNILPVLVYMSKRRHQGFVYRFASFTDTEYQRGEDMGVMGVHSSYIRDYLTHIKHTGKIPIKSIYNRKSVPKGKANINGRYSMLRLTSNTLEFRLLAGTIDWSYVVNMLKLVDTLVDMAYNGVIVDNIASVIAYRAYDLDFKDFMNTTLNQLIRDVRVLSSLEKRGKLFGGLVHDVYHRISPKMVRIGDLVFSKTGLERASVDDIPNIISSGGREVVVVKDDEIVAFQDTEYYHYEKYDTNLVFIRPVFSPLGMGNYGWDKPIVEPTRKNKTRVFPRFADVANDVDTLRHMYMGDVESHSPRPRGLRFTSLDELEAEVLEEGRVRILERG